MKPVVINNDDDLQWSIAKLVFGLHVHMRALGIDSLFAIAGRKYAEASDKWENVFVFGDPLSNWWHRKAARITGLDGDYSRRATARLLRELDARGIDTVYLGMIHHYFINETMLFDWIKRRGAALVYPMFDEYPYLGKCHFQMGCTSLYDGCADCPQAKMHPHSLLAKSAARKTYLRKCANYAGLAHAVFTGPQVVAENARKSPIMRGQRIEAFDEAVDVEVCRPRDPTALRRRLGIPDDKVVCLCAAIYDRDVHDRKGVPYFTAMARGFAYDDRFVFVHVGYKVETPPVKQPPNLICRGFVYDRDEWAQYMSMADLFVFPSMADTMANTCLEAMACGTPLLCFGVYGNENMAPPGVATFVRPGDAAALAEVVQNLKKKTPETIARCRAYALERYDCRKYFGRMVELGEELQRRP